MIFEVIG